MLSLSPLYLPRCTFVYVFFLFSFIFFSVSGSPPSLLFHLPAICSVFFPHSQRERTTAIALYDPAAQEAQFKWCGYENNKKIILRCSPLSCFPVSPCGTRSRNVPALANSAILFSFSLFFFSLYPFISFYFILSFFPILQSTYDETEARVRVRGIGTNDPLCRSE